MKSIFMLLSVVSVIFSSSLMAMEGMEHGSTTADGTFTYSAMAGAIHTEFKVMDLPSMNMKDPDGKTHHVMATFMRNGDKISNIVGKVKLVAPSKKEQIGVLKDYGGGVYAANFTVDEPGKWGIICVFKDEKETHTVKFWYPHMAM